MKDFQYIDLYKRIFAHANLSKTSGTWDPICQPG